MAEADGVWYWFYGSGNMATGWGKADGKWHWFTSSGAWTPGYHHVYADVSVDIPASGLDSLSDLAVQVAVDGKVFYRRCGKDSFQVHGNDFFLTRDKE